MTATTLKKPHSLQSELLTVLPGAALALLMSGAVIYSLSISNWAQGLAILMPMALPGLLTGLIFARLRWLPGWLAHLLGAALAFAWGVQQLGGLMPERLATWRDQGTELLIRAIIWGRVIAGGGRGEDILLFVAALCLLSWAIAYSTAWMIFRRGWIWRPVVLNAIVALMNYTYVLPKPTVPFFIFLCAALLLLVYQHVLERQAQWDAQQVEYPDLLPIRFVWSATLVCGLLIVITAALPGSVSIDRATRTWEALSAPFKNARERWEDLFSTINAPPGAGSGAFTSRGAELGGARLLNDEPVMYVRSTEYDYWRAVAFDKYTGRGWDNTVGEQARAALGAGTPEQARTPRQAEEPLPLRDRRARLEVPQRIQLLADRQDDLIMVGGAALRVSLPTRVEHNYLEDDGSIQPIFDDTSLIVADSPLRAGATYTVTALLSKADVASLRAAGNEYPAWVSARYLQLPDSVTRRTRDRAAQIVADAGARTPYDQAVAIQEALRALPYTENIPAPPAGQDLVDWFLFDQRQGYCDYYASSMVVMLRSLGVPARWVRGYAGGEFDAERGLYVVRENIAHSWPEVYFPGFGWERFEPTPASYTSLPQRPQTSIFGSETEPDLGNLPVPDFPDPGRFEELEEGLSPSSSGVGNLQNAEEATRWQQSLGIIGAILASLALIAAAIYGRWRYELRGLSRVSATYAGIELLADWAGLGQPPHATPQEYAERLGAALPIHRDSIHQIAIAYESERYRRGRRADLPDAQAIQELRRDLIRHMFVSIGDRFPKRSR